MIKMIKRFLQSVIQRLSSPEATEVLMLNQGKILEALYSAKDAKTLSDYEWRVFSQWGEDGIIQFLIREVEIKNETFIEIGAEDFTESNCRYLLESADWQGLVVDGSTENIRKLMNKPLYWRHDLQSIAIWVTAENFNTVLAKSGFDRDLGILSIDVDGNDYHLLKAMNTFEPRIIICEFNPYFGKNRAISVPYDPHFDRTEKHYSNLYFGASIKALQTSLKKDGYTLVGTGRQGGNSYFVRNGLLTDRLKEFAKHPFCFNGHCRESRDVGGKLSFLRGEERMQEIRGMPILNTSTGKLEDL